MNKLLVSLIEIRPLLFTGNLALVAILAFLIGQVSAQTTDTTPPDIVELSFTPSTIDITDNAQTVTVTVRATDAGDGVKSIPVYFRSPIGFHAPSIFMSSQNLISGNSNDGVYRGTIVFPQYSRAGTWNISINPTDGRNFSFLTSSQLVARGFATQLQVISNIEDITPPEISEISLTPTVIDTSSSSQDVTVTVRVKDAQSGVRSVSVNLIYSDVLLPVSMNRISGDDKDGVYQGVTRFFRNQSSGVYPFHVFASDVVTNQTFLDSTQLAARGYPSQLIVNAPRLISISGRVRNPTSTPNNRGLSNATVTLTDSYGNVSYATTNSSGYYRFNQVIFTAIFTIQVKHKRYSFAPQVMSVNQPGGVPSMDLEICLECTIKLDF
jgi:hypothetical protein